MRSWLMDGGSLAARWKARCPGFRVMVLAEGRTRGGIDEAKLRGAAGTCY